MSRKAKIAAAIVGVVVVAIASIPLFVNVNTFKPLIEEQLTTALGRQAKVGNLSLSLFSGSVTADDLSIADDPQYSNQPFVLAKEFHLGVQMRPLIFDHKIIVTSLEIDSPQIHLIHGANGAWNFSTVGQNAAKRTEQQKQQSITPDFTVDSFKIKDGHAVVESLPAVGAPMVYDKVNVTVDGFSFTKVFPFTVSADFPGQGTITVTGKSGPINIQDAAKTPFDAQVMLRHLDPVATGFLEKSAGLSVLADIDAHAVSDSTTITSNGTVHTQHLQLRPDAAPAPKPIDLTYSVVHDLSDNTGQVQDAAFQTGKVVAHIKGSYSMKPGGAMTVNLKLAGQGIPIDDLQTLFPAAGVKLPHGSVLQGGTLTTSLSIVGPLDALVITGPVELSGTRLAGFNPSSQLKGIVAAATGDTGNITNIQSLKVQLQVAKDEIRANNLYLSMPAIGDAVGDGTVSPSGALNFKLKMKVDTSRGVGGKAVGLLSLVNGTAGKTASQAAATGLPVTITGTSSNPIITPDVSGMMKANGKKLTNSIMGLFGKKK
ncbi:MAG: AsmA family protein [Edaphobacter sp.]